MQFPRAFIGWAIEPRWLPLLTATTSETPLVDQLHEVATRAWKQAPASASTLSGIYRLAGELAQQRYDLCIDLQGSIRSAAIGRLASASRLVGPEPARERIAGLLYTQHVTLTATNVIDQAGELISAGAGMSVRPLPIDFPLDQASEAWAETFPPGFILIVPNAGWGAKEWPADAFSSVAEALQRSGYRVLINADSSSTLSVSAQHVSRVSGAPIAASNLSQMIALTRRAALVFGGDTGPVHLAAAMGRPVVALFGPTDPARNGPAFPAHSGKRRVIVLRNSSSYTDHRRLQQTEAGLAAIKVEKVLAAAFALLGTGEM